MASMHYTARVRSGLLLELPGEAEQLHLNPGERVQVQLERELDPVQSTRANEGMLAALREIAERQKGRRYTDPSDTNKMLREGRAGVMWGCAPID